MPEMNFDKPTDLEIKLFSSMGISDTDMNIIHDLSKLAAEKAVESMKIVAGTAPDLRMIPVISLVGCLLCGHAAASIIEQQTDEALAKLDPEQRRMFDEIMKHKPSFKRQGVRDFDGNYR
jgi:hypothetical protein